MRIRFSIKLILLGLLASYGCGGSSEVEMRQAQDAMDQAKGLHADGLASTDFQKAKKAWDRALAAQKEGKSDTAKVLFTSAKIYFGNAADIAKSRKETLSRQLEGMQSATSKNLEQVMIDLANANATRRTQVEAILAEVDKNNASIDKLVAEQDLPKAVQTAKNVQTKVYHAQLILAGQKVR